LASAQILFRKKPAAGVIETGGLSQDVQNSIVVE
jgi:hypothetical protein